MPQLAVYQIDTFTSQVFSGNPAAVCPLETWLDDAVLQSIAAENNLSETAFFVQQGDHYAIRWFTPTVEVDLCGHATLAAAFVLFKHLAYDKKNIIFTSKSGELRVHQRESGKLELDFPKQTPMSCDIPQFIAQAFGNTIKTCLKAEDYVVVLHDEAAVRTANPDMSLLRQLDLRGVVITATAKEYDFVSRFFAPHCGIDEDSATGSSFTQLAPYWSGILGKQKFVAKQVSKRGGEVWCEVAGDRVYISGQAITYLKGMIFF